MTTIISLLLLYTAAVAYAISQASQHGRFGDGEGFWGKNSDKRKYKQPLQPAPNNWYYSVNVLKYHERFPLSGSLLISLTDSYHFFQMLAVALICLSLAILTNHPVWMWFAYRTAWGVAFSITYKISGR